MQECDHSSHVGAAPNIVGQYANNYLIAMHRVSLDTKGSLTNDVWRLQSEDIKIRYMFVYQVEPCLLPLSRKSETHR